MHPAPQSGTSTRTTWRCPECAHVPLVDDGPELACSSCGATYPIAFGTPVLLRRDNDVFRREDYTGEPPAPRARSAIGRILPDPSVNLSFDRVVARLTRLVAELGEPASVLLVGSGSLRPDQDRLTAMGLAGDVVAVDVDAAADVDAFCDAHDLPFPDGSFDAVLSTAVLEHVLDPQQVVAEIHRVLRPGGLVYTEIPFMQQVHEGAYDFTRFTLSGHRRLMRHFDELESGAAAGPGTALAWSIEHFLVAVAPRRSAPAMRAVSRLLFAWLKHVDRFVAQRPAALDAASCTYFLGRRREDGPVSDAAIIAGYRGNRGWSMTSPDQG